MKEISEYRRDVLHYQSSFSFIFDSSYQRTCLLALGHWIFLSCCNSPYLHALYSNHEACIIVSLQMPIFSGNLDFLYETSFFPWLLSRCSPVIQFLLCNSCNCLLRRLELLRRSFELSVLHQDGCARSTSDVSVQI